MAPKTPPLVIVMRSREDVTSFLAGRPDPDQPVTWRCPDCGRDNSGIHHARSTPCECGKYAFPPIHLPLKVRGDVALTVAIAERRIEEIDKDISKYEDEISGFEGEIEEREDWISELRKERKSVMASAGLS